MPTWVAIVIIIIIIIYYIIYFMVLSTPLIIAGYYLGGVPGGVAGAVILPIGYYAYSKYTYRKNYQLWAAQEAERKARVLEIANKKGDENTVVDKNQENSTVNKKI